jgi:multidrug efflux pump subunit AcrB/ABC-type multidrug transport system ATPase subunit
MLIVLVNSSSDADPSYVEKLGVIPMESAIAGLDNIERIESYIRRKNATIFVYYTQNSNQKYAYLKLQERVAAHKENMGEGFSATVQKVNTQQLSNQFMVYQARGEGSLDQIRQVVDEKIVTELENIDGIANVEVYGGQQHSIEIILDEVELSSYDLTIAQVSSQISQGSSSPQYLGQVTEGRKKIFVNLVTDYTSLSDIGEIVIKEQGPLLLKHIATIVDGGAEVESIARINGMESVRIALTRSQEANLLSLARKTRQIIDDLNQQVSRDGISLVIQSDEAEAIENNMDTIMLLALVGGLLAIAILWIFLKNLPLVMIVAITIPISVLISMNLFYALDITINTLTLVGIAIAIGMLLDNSIVVLENIHRQVAQGKDARQAVIAGTREVWRAVFAATLTTVCVFIPFIFSGNYLVKTLGRQIGVAIISTLLVSLAVAFLLIPAFTYRFLSKRRNLQSSSFNVISQKNRLMQIYTLFLKSCLRFPARTIVIGVVVFFISVVFCLMASINVPQEIELDNFNLYAIMPSGTTLESADEQALEMDEHLKNVAEIEERRANIQEDNIVLNFKLVEDYEDTAEQNINAIKEDIFDELSDAFPRIDFSYDEPTQNVKFQGGGGGGQNFTRLLGIGASQEKVVVQGQDLDLLRAIAEDIQYNIDELETVRNSSLSVSDQSPSIDLFLDKSAMSHFNVSLQSIRNELNSFRKETSSGANLKQGTEEINIILKNKDEKDKISEDLRQLQVPSSSGGTIPLMQLAQMVFSTGYSAINRVNQEKQVVVTYRFESEIEDSKQLLEEARTSVEQIVADITPPPGVLIEVVHDESDLSEFYFLIFVGILLIYMVLASTFESLITPLAMMFTLPLATIGAFWGLILTGNSIFNANVMVGFLILLGVVVNNGIILIDYSRLLRKRKFRPIRALLTAGQVRVRPILITTLTTILAMLPIALGKAEYISQIGAPFAITVIGGLSAATIFTLLLVPTVSFGIENTLLWWRRLNWKIKVIQLVVFSTGVMLLYKNVDSFLWQVAYTAVLLAVIPAFTYFVQISLKRSRATVIPKNQPIKITIRNVNKFYDNYSRFIREWRQGKRQQERLEKEGRLQKAGGSGSLFWQLPLYLFLFYFSYYYLPWGFWVLVFSVAFYIYTLILTRPFLLPQRERTSSRRGNRLRTLLFKLIFWGLPLANLIWYRGQWGRLEAVILIAGVWYLAITVYSTSQKLYREKIDINRISGRLKRIRKSFYRFVKIIPVIGKQRVPFRALNQVSLEIESGMFGLIGPNGAGKTTLMRIICGILQPSQGKVMFNDIDLQSKREEFQSLIGYLPQEFGTYENMTAYQFLDYQALLKGLWDTDRRRKVVEHAISSVHLDEDRDVKIKAFSGGMKQRIGISQTLLQLPRILVVDEPTAGLDPRERIRFRNMLSELARDRVVIFSTHIIEDISSSCNRVAVLDDGGVKFIGTPLNMIELTQGFVWQARITEKAFEAIRPKTWIVHHMHDGELIRVRILAREKPLTEAMPVTPTLEDSYMWLISQKE